MAAGRVRAWLLASSALVVAGAAPIPSLAANTTWTNSNATDVWSDNANWDTNAKPAGADDALITSVGTAGTAVTVNTDETANSVTVSNGNQVNISAGNTLSAGTVAINIGSTIQVGGSLSGTTTNAGTLNIGIGSTGGVLTGDVSNTGTLLFNRADASAYSGIISGSGTVTKQGAGTLTLSGLSTYTGGSTISAGTVNLSQLTFFNPGPLSSGLGLGAIALDGGKLLTSTTGSLANDLTFNANKTSILAAAAGTTLTLGGDPNISGNTATALTFGANAVAQFGSATDTGTIRIGASSNSPTIDSSSSVVVAGGKLQDFQDALWHVLSGVDSLTINAGATVDYNDSALQVIVNLNGAGSVTSGTTGTNTLTIFSTTGATNTFSGVISGSHPVSFNTTGGAATMILTGENTYTGGTTICFCGTLQLGDGGTTGSVLGDIDNEGTLIFNRSNSYTFNGVISDTGNVIQNGAGTTFLSADNTYSGGTAVNAGRLVVGNGGATGSIVGNVTVASGAAFGVNRSDTYTVPNAISGAGGFVQLGTGTTIFDTAQAYTGDTTISAGTLQIGNGGVAGSLASTTIVDNGTLAINKSNSYGLAANISGTGGLNQIGNGTTSLTGTNTYAGPTNVTAGILRAGVAGAFSPNSAFNVGALGTLNLSGFDQTIGSLAGSGPVRLSIATLTTGNDNTGTTYSGAIQGAGGLTKAGTGNFVLSGTSAYTGATTVNAGTLSVNGDISSSSVVTVNSGGTLGGTGTLPSTVINSGGTLAPGNSIGTINVSGDLNFNSGAYYLIQLSPSTSDRTNVTGSAALAGTVAASFDWGSNITRQYTLLTATGGRSGTFDSLVTSSLPANFTAALTYDANNAYLDLVLNYGAPSGFGSGLSENQQAVADALTNYFNTTGGIPTVFTALTPDGLTQVSGQSGAGIIQNAFDASNQFINLMFDPANAGAFGGNGAGQGGPTAFADAALGYAPNKNAAATDAFAALDGRTPDIAHRWNVWAAGYGGNSTVSGNATAGTNTTTSRVYGTAAGATYRLTPDTLVGFGLGGAGTSYSLDGGLGGGHADLFQGGLFLRHTMGAAYAAGGLAYGWQDVSTDRTVSVSGTSRLEANFAASTFAARAEAGYRFAVARAGVTPYAALQSSLFHSPSYTETATSGSGQFALAYASQTTTNIRTELGLRADTSLPMLDGALTLRGRAVWAHDGNTDRLVTATFDTLPGATFTVNGARPAADAALVSLGVELGWKNGWSLAGNFDGEFSPTTSGYAGRGVLRRVW